MEKKQSCTIALDEHQKIGIYNPTEQFKSDLKGNFLKVHTELIGLGAYKSMMQLDEIELPTSAIKTSNYIMDIKVFSEFFSEKTQRVYNDMNLKLSRGALFHGIQGSGKTTLMYSIAKNLMIEYQNIIGVSINSYYDLKFALEFAKEYNKNFEPCIFVYIMDECDHYMDEREDQIKVILDGTSTPSNSIFLASTNYINQIPESIKNRPSRFKYVIDLDKIHREEIIYSIYKDFNDSLSDDLKIKDEEIKSIVPSSVGSTFDELKHVFLDMILKK